MGGGKAVKDLVVTPHVTTLGEAGFTPHQNVFEGSCAGAESIPRIFTQPLMEISWCWMDVISSSGDKAKLLRFHIPQVLLVDPPPPYPTVSTVPGYHGRLPWPTLLLPPVYDGVSTTIFLHSGAMALFHSVRLAVNPRPLLPC